MILNIDAIVESVRHFLFGNSASFGFFTHFSFNRFLFWTLIICLAMLVMFRLLRRHPFWRLGANFTFGVGFGIAAYMSERQKEIQLAAGIFLFLITCRCLNVLLMWLPMRLQYRASADEELRELEGKVTLSDEEIQRVYTLRKRSSKAYHNNMEWLRKIVDTNHKTSNQ